MSCLLQRKGETCDEHQVMWIKYDKLKQYGNRNKLVIIMVFSDIYSIFAPVVIEYIAS